MTIYQARLVALTVGVVLCWASWRLCEAQDSNRTAPDEVIERLVSLRHGLSFLDDEHKALLSRVRANPEVYAPAIERVLAQRLDERVVGARDAVHRLSRGVELASRLEPTFICGALQKFFDETFQVATLASQQRGAPMPVDPNALSENAYRNSVSLRDQTLDVLADFGDPHAVDACVRSIENQRRAMTEATMLRYLEKVGPLRPDIRPKLEEMYNSPTSPLRNHPQLLRVLEAMDSAAAEPKKEAGNDKSRDGNRKDE